MPRHFLFGSDSVQGFHAVKPHFLPWIRAVVRQTFQTNAKQHEFTVKISNEDTGDLEICLESGARLIIKSRLWKYALSRFIQESDLVEGFGYSYLKPLVKSFLDHIIGDCSCFASDPLLTKPIVSKSTAGVWQPYL